MGRGKFKGKSTGRRQFSTQEEMGWLVSVFIVPNCLVFYESCGA
ncbi:unnamed protein product [Rhodiola kirilowii]